MCSSDLVLGLAGLGSNSKERLIGSWKRLSSSGRFALLGTLVSKEEGIELLVRSIRTGLIPSADIDASTIQRLRSDAPTSVKETVHELFGPAPGSDRPEVVRRALSQWPSKTDPSLGQAAYQKHCAVCHDPRRHQEDTHESLGPNLRGLGHWTNEAWMTAILDPSRSVEEKYWVFQARTVDGKLLTGLKLSEDESSIEWVDGTGRIERMPKSEIEEMRESERSLMPEGFEQLLKIGRAHV